MKGYPFIICCVYICIYRTWTIGIEGQHIKTVYHIAQNVGSRKHGRISLH